MKTDYYHTTMLDMENMDAIEWAEYLAYGDPVKSELTTEQEILTTQWEEMYLHEV